jgi:hypothetical protein
MFALLKAGQQGCEQLMRSVSLHAGWGEIQVLIITPRKVEEFSWSKVVFSD